MQKLSILLVATLLSTELSAREHPESWYQDQYCTGKKEVVQDDKTRIDCLTSHYAIEYDFANKWAEGIGQALHYGRMTGKQPGLVLIVESLNDCKYVERTQANIDHYWLPIRLQTIGISC